MSSSSKFSKLLFGNVISTARGERALIAHSRSASAEVMAWVPTFEMQSKTLLCVLGLSLDHTLLAHARPDHFCNASYGPVASNSMC